MVKGWMHRYDLFNTRILYSSLTRYLRIATRHSSECHDSTRTFFFLNAADVGSLITVYMALLKASSQSSAQPVLIREKTCLKIGSKLAKMKGAVLLIDS